MTDSAVSAAEYLCPGQEHPISRAMHLARLVEFYPACRCCRFREDTKGLSEKLIERLHEVWADPRGPAGICEEGFCGNSPNDLPPDMARQAAAAFGLWLQRSREATTPCRIAVAHDGRPIAPEYVAAICEGVRFAACEAFDLGPATSAMMQFAVAHFDLDGGILLGSANRQPTRICMKFWRLGLQRLLGESIFQPLQAILQNGLDRPARSFGPLHRMQAETPYLSALAGQFHGLRPLRFVVDATSRPWIELLEKLLQTTACRIIPCRVLPHEFPGQIVGDNAHFGVRVFNDGECCEFFDEQGRQFAADSSDALAAIIRLLQFLSRDDRPCSESLDVIVE